MLSMYIHVCVYMAGSPVPNEAILPLLFYCFYLLNSINCTKLILESGSHHPNESGTQNSTQHKKAICLCEFGSK